MAREIQIDITILAPDSEDSILIDRLLEAVKNISREHKASSLTFKFKVLGDNFITQETEEGK